MTQLVVPDIRTTNLSVGWAENNVLPAVINAVWDDLDEYEATLRATASYIDSLQSGDAVELEKALRIVEARRGELLDITVTPGAKPDLSMHEKVADVAAATATRYRKIARHWRTIWPEVARCTERRDVTQAAVLRMIERVEQAASPAKPTPPEPAAKPAPEPKLEEEFEVDPMWEWERAEKELDRANRTIESMAKDDQAKEVLILHSRIAGLEGRVSQLTTTASEARRQADLQGKVLRKVRELLGLANNSDIVPAIQDLMR